MIGRTSPSRSRGNVAPGGRRIMLFRGIALVLTFAILELLSAITIAVVPYPRIRRASTLYAEQSQLIRQLLDSREPRHTELDPVLGWRHTPNFPGARNRMNSAGLRGAREYARVPQAGVLRVAAFGDSFVYGAEVDNAASWTGVIERESGNIEVLNYGVSGYGVDQAYLRYLLEGQAFSPDVVLMGFVPDDINRTVNVYRRFLSPGGVNFKPRYALTGSQELTLMDVPLKTLADYQKLLTNPTEITRIGRNDYWYPPCVYENPLHDYSATVRLACGTGGLIYRRLLDPDRPVKGAFFNEDSTAFKIQAALFSHFTRAVRSHGALPLIVMLPDMKAVDRSRRHRPSIYEPVIRYLRSHDIPYADAVEAFPSDARESDAKTWFAPGGHYSPAGNHLVATWLTGKLRQGATQSPRFSPAADLHTLKDLRVPGNTRWSAKHVTRAPQDGS